MKEVYFPVRNLKLQLNNCCNNNTNIYCYTPWTLYLTKLRVLKGKFNRYPKQNLHLVPFPQQKFILTFIVSLAKLDKVFCKISFSDESEEQS